MDSGFRYAGDSDDTPLRLRQVWRFLLRFVPAHALHEELAFRLMLRAPRMFNTSAAQANLYSICEVIRRPPTR